MPLHLGINGSKTASQVTYHGCTIGEKIRRMKTDMYTLFKKSFFENIIGMYANKNKIPQVNLVF